MVRSALALAALATTAVRGLDVVATRPPQRVTTEYQSTGMLDGGGRHWVILAPLTPAAGAALEGEVALLSQLARAVDDGRLPYDVARPAGFAELPEGGRAMVYRELVGRPVDLDRLAGGPGLAAELGRAIAAFHELDDAVIADAGLPVYDADSYRRRCLAEVDEAARTGHMPSVLLNRWEHALEDVALWRFRATPVHGDLAPEHVLVADGRVSALTGFAAAHVGDPAEDLAWLLASAPEDSLDAIAESYAMHRAEGADANLLDRALLYSEIALARWLLHGTRTGDRAVADDAVGMLRTLAAEVTDEPDIGARDPHVVPDWSVEAPDDEHSGEIGTDAAPGPLTDSGPANAQETSSADQASSSLPTEELHLGALLDDDGRTSGDAEPDVRGEAAEGDPTRT